MFDLSQGLNVCTWEQCIWKSKKGVMKVRFVLTLYKCIQQLFKTPQIGIQNVDVGSSLPTHRVLHLGGEICKLFSFEVHNPSIKVTGKRIVNVIVESRMQPWPPVVYRDIANFNFWVLIQITIPLNIEIRLLYLYKPWHKIMFLLNTCS